MYTLNVYAPDSYKLFVRYEVCSKTFDVAGTHSNPAVPADASFVMFPTFYSILATTNLLV